MTTFHLILKNRRIAWVREHATKRRIEALDFASATDRRRPEVMKGNKDDATFDDTSLYDTSLYNSII